MGESQSFSKGQLVRIVRDPDAGFCLDQEAIHIYTAAERERLYSDPRYRGLDDGGEPRTVPGHCYVRLPPGELLHVIRARARPPFSRRGSWALVLNVRTGMELYVRRGSLEPVEGGE